MAPLACSGEVDFSQVEERATPLVEFANRGSMCGTTWTYFDDGTVIRQTRSARDHCLEEGIFSISSADLEELKAALAAPGTSFAQEIEPPPLSCENPLMDPPSIPVVRRVGESETEGVCIYGMREENPIRVFLEPFPEMTPSE